MAGETLQDSLSGLRFSGADNFYGLGASTLASSLPALINPRSSVGRNIAIGLGGTLLTALLGYQARQQASEDTIATMDYGNQILGASSPEEQFAIATAVEDTQQKAKLLTLVNALKTNETVNKLNNQIKDKDAERKLLYDQALLFGIPANKVEGALNANAEAKLVLSQTPESGVEGVPPLPPFYSAEQKANYDKAVADKIEKDLRASQRTEDKATAEENKIYNRVDAARKALATSPNTKAYQEAASNQKNLEVFLNGNSAQDDLAAVQVLTRVLNPGNMVTVQETGQVMTAQSYIEMISGKISKLATGGSQLSASTKAQMRNLGLTAVTSFGELYSQEARALYKPIAEYGRPIEDILTFPLSPEKKNTARSLKAQAALAYLKQGQR
jgi:hypothetical protein